MSTVYEKPVTATSVLEQTPGAIADVLGTKVGDLEPRDLGRDFLSSERWLRTFLLITDVVGVVLCAFLANAVNLAYRGVSTEDQFGLETAWIVFVLPVLFVVCGFLWSLYERRALNSVFSPLVPLAGTTLSAWGLLLLLHYMIEFAPIGRWTVFLGIGASWCVLACTRAILTIKKRSIRKRVIYVGSHDEDQSPGSPRVLVQDIPGVALQADFCESRLLRSVSYTRPFEDIERFCRSQEIDLILVREGCRPETMRAMLQLAYAGARVVGVQHYYERMAGKVPVDSISFDWVLSADLHRRSPLARAMKRGTDLVIAGLGLAVTLPLWPIIAILIKLTSRGSVFYRQRRVGRNGKVFNIIKFRTMFVDAESEGKAVWASEDDARVTKVGRVLRNTRLDELPQFINVLKGAMSVVGPRPERPELVEQLEQVLPLYGLRHFVNPGITGWAQVAYHYGASVEDAREKLCYDLYYVKYGDLAMDIAVMFRTARAMISGSR